MRTYWDWTRRDVVKTLLAGGVACLAPSAEGESLRVASGSRIAIAASDWRRAAPSLLCCYHVAANGDATELLVQNANNISALALNASRDRLYAANCVAQTDFLPCGSVETFAIRFEPFRLTLLKRTSLAIGSACPTGLALSPDDALLAVNCSASGILNVLPIDRNGCAGTPSVVHKRLGSIAAALDEEANQRIHFVSLRTLLVSERGRSLRSYHCDSNEIKEQPASEATYLQSGAPLDGELVLRVEGRAQVDVVWI